MGLFILIQPIMSGGVLMRVNVLHRCKYFNARGVALIQLKIVARGNA